MNGRPVRPRPAATVMVLRDGPGGLEVLLLRRSDALSFVPGAHVFPGGAVDAADSEPATTAVVSGRTDAEASALLGIDSGGLAFFVAAVRECIEEAGVVIGHPVDDPDGPVPGDHPALDDLDRLRPDIEAGRLALHEWCRARDVVLDAGRMRYVSRWITPEASPKRFDTRFFAVELPPGQRATADGDEATEARWWSPAEALAAHERGEIVLIEPTWFSVDLLARFSSCAEALAALDYGQRHAHRVREGDDGSRVPIPADSRGGQVP